MAARKKHWNADSSRAMFPELHGLPVEPPKPLAGTIEPGSSTPDMLPVEKRQPAPAPTDKP